MKKTVIILIEFLVNLPLIFKLIFKRKRALILLLSPEYLNYGDHGIANAEMAFFREHYSTKNVIDINFSFFKYYSKIVRRFVSDNDIIILTGGGYVGSLWHEEQIQVDKALEMFSNNRIIIAPQTIYFDANSFGESKVFSKTIKDQGVFILSRESKTDSLLQTIGLIPQHDYASFPDFFLFTRCADFRVDTSATQTEKPAVCLRVDRESVIQTSDIHQFLNHYYGHNLPNIVMAKDHFQIPTWCRKSILRYKLKQFSKYSIVITDRLHAMLFCAFVGTNCIVFDNKSGKIKGVYEWIKTLPYIRVIDDYRELPNTITSLSVYSDRSMKLHEYRKLSSQLVERYGPFLLSLLEDTED